MNKIKDRARRKAALSDRKSAAAQARMKSIANLAADERVPKKRRKVNGGEYRSALSYIRHKLIVGRIAQRTRSARTTRTGRYTVRS